MTRIKNSFVSQRVDVVKLRYGLNVVESDRNERLMIDELISNKAPYEMLHRFYGMGSKTYRDHRKMHGLSKRDGRTPKSTEAQDKAVWDVFQERQNGSSPDELSAADYLFISRETGVILRTVWRLVQGWANDELI